MKKCLALIACAALALSACSPANQADENDASNPSEPSGAAVVSGVGKTEEESLPEERVGTVIGEIKADLTHDGKDETIKIEALAYALGRPDEARIKVYKDGEEKPLFVSRDFGGAHAVNGTACLVERDEGAYIAICDIYEMQGEADYSYSVVYLNDDGIVEVDKDEVEFSVWEDLHEDWDSLTHRDDAVPDFKAKLEKWLDGAEILVSFDIDSEDDVIIATDGEEIPAETYFDPVWERDW